MFSSQRNESDMVIQWNYFDQKNANRVLIPIEISTVTIWKQNSQILDSSEHQTSLVFGFTVIFTVSKSRSYLTSLNHAVYTHHLHVCGEWYGLVRDIKNPNHSKLEARSSIWIVNMFTIQIPTVFSISSQMSLHCKI